MLQHKTVLARVNLKFPSYGQLLFERRLCIFDGLDLRVKDVSLLKIIGFAFSTINFKDMFILGSPNPSTLFPNGYFCNFIFLFLIFLLHRMIDIEGVLVSGKMVLQVVGAESIEAFHADEQSIRFGLGKACNTG